jgi:hypothetical protein
MKTNFKEGRLYHITFLDHSVGIKDKMIVEAVGWCVEDGDDYAVFTSWQVIHDDKEMVNDNHEPFAVIKSCVKRKRILPT